MHGGICRDFIQNQSIAILFTPWSCFLEEPDGKVSLIVRFLEKSREHQRKWSHIESKIA